MWDQIFTMASNTGIWAVLFVSLFFIQLRDSKKREEKYQATIAALAESFQITEEIAAKVKDIHEILSEAGADSVPLEPDDKSEQK